MLHKLPLPFQACAGDTAGVALHGQALCHTGCRLPSRSWRNTSTDSDLCFLAGWRDQMPLPDADPIYTAECWDAALLPGELYPELQTWPRLRLA